MNTFEDFRATSIVIIIAILLLVLGERGNMRLGAFR
jgi:hypothetical protein